MRHVALFLKNHLKQGRRFEISARTVYADHHVYPYTYLGCFMFRNQRFSEALQCYANAAQVIRNFNYGREDEEIYKEFMEVNNEIIPQLVRYPGKRKLVLDKFPFPSKLIVPRGLSPGDW